MAFGSLIIYDGKIGLVVTDVDSETAERHIALFNPIDSKFEFFWSRPTPLALKVDAEIVIEVDLRGGAELSAHANRTLTSRLLTRGNEAYFVLPLNPGFFSYADIRTGVVKTVSPGQTMSCSKWKLGIRREPHGDPMWLIEVN
jgi:hypothetical protein